jgi:Helix-turn-helix domain
VTERLLTASEVADRLSVPESWVREQTRADAIPHLTLGRYKRYDWSAVAAWLESQRAGQWRKHRPFRSAGRGRMIGPCSDWAGTTRSSFVGCARRRARRPNLLRPAVSRVERRAIVATKKDSLAAGEATAASVRARIDAIEANQDRIAEYIETRRAHQERMQELIDELAFRLGVKLLSREPTRPALTVVEGGRDA